MCWSAQPKGQLLLQAPLVFWGSPGCRIGLCCTGFAFQGELAPCVAAARPKCGCRAQTCHPLSGVSLGTKSSCKEWMTGRSCWCSLLLLSDSSPTEDMDRGRKDQQHFCLWHKSTQGRTAGVLPIPGTFPPCPSGVCMPWTLGPAALGELWSVLCPRGGTSCSWLSPAWPSEPAVCSHGALGTCPLLNQCLLGCREGRAGGFSKENSKPESPVAINAEPCVFTEGYE